MTTMPQKQPKTNLSRSKNPLALLLCLFIVVLGYGQNFVENPSFEDTIKCPFVGDVNDAVNWKNAGGSPDYYHPCSVVPDLSVPYNWGGFQQAKSGIAYVGFGTYLSDPQNTREYICGKLTVPLEIGQKYYLSLNVSLALKNETYFNTASNNIGVKFSNVQHAEFVNPILPNNYSHINFSDIVTDSLNWIRISGSFIADSNYSYINIGNFFDDVNTTIQIFQQDTYQTAYYFVDDVCVSTDSLTCNSTAGIKEQVKNDYSFISSNPANEKFIIKVNSYSNTYIEIIDLNGKILLKKNVNYDTEIDCSTWNTGVYFVKLTNNLINKSQKLIINH